MKVKLRIGLLILTLLLTMLPLPSGAVTDMNLYTPQNLKATLMTVDGTHPHGSADLTFSVSNLPVGETGAEYAIEIEKKIGEGNWIGVSFDSTRYYSEERSLGNGMYHFEQIWNEDTVWSGTQTVSWRMRIALCDSTFSAIDNSAWSNIASIGIKASSWATSGIEKALGYGLVPDSIKADYTAPITRQEFAELATMLYEVYTNTTATPVAPNPFTDCSNISVLKAFNLGIVRGVSAVKFDPNALTNREQIAAMLHRAVTALNPAGADMTTDGAPVFADAASISSWFLEDVKFMSKNGFILGSNGSFNPKGTSTREMAVLIAVRVYEKYADVMQ